MVVSWAAWTETSSMVYAWFNGDLVIEEVINSKLLVPDSDAEGELGEDWKGTIRKFKLYDAPRGSELMAYWYIGKFRSYFRLTALCFHRTISRHF